MFIPYTKQNISRDDMAAVLRSLRGDLITRGIMTDALEIDLCNLMNATFAVSFSSGTAALIAAVFAAHERAGLASITTTTNTFSAIANAAHTVGRTLDLCDISFVDYLGRYEFESNILPDLFVPMDYAGYPTESHLSNIKIVIRDACHSLPAWIGRRPLDTSLMTVFSFHPAKHIAAGEGGAVITNDPEMAHRLRLFRNNGIDTRDGVRSMWGMNLHMDEMSAALAYSQLQRILNNHKRLRDIADFYKASFAKVSSIVLPPTHPNHAWHLFAIGINSDIRNEVRAKLLAKGIGTQVHYRPLHRQPYIDEISLESRQRDFPSADLFYSQAISIPMFAGLTDEETEKVVISVVDVINDLV